MAVLPREAKPGAQQLTKEEGKTLLDRVARRRLGISGDEFLRRWDAGDYEGKADLPPVSSVAMLIPFGR